VRVAASESIIGFGGARFRCRARAPARTQRDLAYLGPWSICCSTQRIFLRSSPSIFSLGWFANERLESILVIDWRDNLSNCVSSCCPLWTFNFFELVYVVFLWQVVELIDP
jgi:hypothetical protein